MESCIFLELDVNSGRCNLNNMVLAIHVIGDFLRMGSTRYFQKNGLGY